MCLKLHMGLGTLLNLFVLERGEEGEQDSCKYINLISIETLNCITSKMYRPLAYIPKRVEIVSTGTGERIV